MLPGSLGDSAEKRSSRYLDDLNTKIPVGECAFIQDAVDRGQLTGNGSYIEEVEKIIGHRIKHRRPGRPKKDK